MGVDELGALGVEQMTDEAIEQFLERRHVAVLGLPTDEAPYLVPLSYGFDGESLYFTFVEGAESRKAALCAECPVPAQALVLQVDSAVSWESVQLTGQLSPVPDQRIDDAAAHLETAWRPAVLEDIEGEVRLYELSVGSWSGLRHAGLPEGFPGGPE